MISFIIRSGFLVGFISLLFYATYNVGIKNYFKDSNAPIISFLQVLNESSSSKLNTKWDEWYEIIHSNSTALSVNMDGFSPLTDDEMMKLSKLNLNLKDFNLDDLQTYDYAIHEGELWNINYRELRFSLTYNLKQILHLKNANSSYDSNVYLETLFKLPLIAERVSPELLGKMIGTGMQRSLLSFCHTLYIQGKLLPTEVSAMIRGVEAYSKLSSNLEDTVQHEKELTLLSVRRKHKEQYIFSFVLQLFGGDVIAPYKNFMNNPKLLTLSNTEYTDELYKLPRFAQYMINNFVTARFNVKRVQLHGELLKCELIPSFKMGKHFKMNVVNGSRYCEVDTNFDEFTNKDESLVLKVFK